MAGSTATSELASFQYSLVTHVKQNLAIVSLIIVNKSQERHTKQATYLLLVMCDTLDCWQCLLNWSFDCFLQQSLMVYLDDSFTLVNNWKEVFTLSNIDLCLQLSRYPPQWAWGLFSALNPESRPPWHFEYLKRVHSKQFSEGIFKIKALVLKHVFLNFFLKYEFGLGLLRPEGNSEHTAFSLMSLLAAGIYNSIESYQIWVHRTIYEYINENNFNL